MFALTEDGAILCRECCRAEYRQIATAYPGDGWNVVGISNEGETDAREMSSAFQTKARRMPGSIVTIAGA